MGPNIPPNIMNFSFMQPSTLSHLTIEIWREVLSYLINCTHLRLVSHLFRQCIPLELNLSEVLGKEQLDRMRATNPVTAILQIATPASLDKLLTMAASVPSLKSICIYFHDVPILEEDARHFEKLNSLHLRYVFRSVVAQEGRSAWSFPSSCIATFRPPTNKQVMAKDKVVDTSLTFCAKICKRETHTEPCFRLIINQTKKQDTKCSEGSP